MVVGGLSLVALAGAAAVMASSSMATSMPKAAIASAAAFAQATKPLPPASAPERNTEIGPDGGAISGTRKAPAPSAANSFEPGNPEPASYPTRNREIRIEAPNTDVRVNADTGRVRVDAPYALVDVNPNTGRATVRAPGFSLDLRW